jgi:hypothetical protein
LEEKLSSAGREIKNSEVTCGVVRKGKRKKPKNGISENEEINLTADGETRGTGGKTHLNGREELFQAGIERMISEHYDRGRKKREK